VVLQRINGALPMDTPKGIYVVLASADVTATSGFCTCCGLARSSDRHRVKYTFIMRTAARPPASPGRQPQQERRPTP
jgi:hypothetical protein